jgi:hypothetical protein
MVRGHDISRAVGIASSSTTADASAKQAMPTRTVRSEDYAVRLITDVELRNFRSCRTVTLDALQPYVPIDGLNGSGKSNLLRALSLYFSNEVEPGVALNLKRDHFDPGRPLGGRRRASVRVTFDLSAGYEPRKEVARVFERLGVTDQIRVERAWSYADPSATAVSEEILAGAADELEALDDDDARAVGTFVRSIKFRYVPNHIRPSELLGSEIQTLRRAINRRVRSRSAFRTGGVQEALDDLGAVTTEMLSELSLQIASHSPELAGVAPDIPKDFAELAFQLGLTTVTSSGLRQAPDLQGSGTQSYLLFHVLDLVDRSAFEVDFGWTKAVVWAIEEPESFLHAGLRTRLAEDLAAFAGASRRQVFVTTHEQEFQRVADDVWIAGRQGATTTFARSNARDAVVASSRLRISSYQHPLFLSPDRPLVIAEGVTDVRYIELAAEAMDLKPLWSVVSLHDLEETKKGGSDVEAYLRANASVLRSRPLHARSSCFATGRTPKGSCPSSWLRSRPTRRRNASVHPRRSATRISARSSVVSSGSSQRLWSSRSCRSTFAPRISRRGCLSRSTSGTSTTTRRRC